MQVQGSRPTMTSNDRNCLGAGKTHPQKNGTAELQPGTEIMEALEVEPERSLLMQKAQEIVNHTPDVREDRVAALRTAIQQGTYQIDARQLANILITRFILKR
jgi:flagellar biosynthesis anti-sigma factor FlgM